MTFNELYQNSVLEGRNLNEKVLLTAISKTLLEILEELKKDKSIDVKELSNLLNVKTDNKKVVTKAEKE
jgi:hypothetical protein